MAKRNLKQTLRVGFIYFLLSTLLIAVVFFSYILRSASLSFMDVGGWVYFVCSCLSHAALFAALPFVVLYMPSALLGGGPKLSGTLMCIGEVLLTVGFIVNGFVYGLYHFHINGLVLSMLTGPGAAEIFVFSPWLYLKSALYVAAVIAVGVALLWLSIRLERLLLPHLWRDGLLAVLAFTLLAQAMHIYAAATLKRSVLEATGFAVDDPDDEDGWERKLELAKELFEGMAGLCSATDYELWFKDTGAKADIKPDARLSLCEDDMKELLFEIMESVEDTLELHGGMVKNPERDEAIADYQKHGWDTNGICHLYGVTYADLQDTIKAVLASHGIIEED